MNGLKECLLREVDINLMVPEEGIEICQLKYRMGAWFVQKFLYTLLGVRDYEGDQRLRYLGVRNVHISLERDRGRQPSWRRRFFRLFSWPRG